MKKQQQLIKNTLIIFFGRVSTQLISYFLLPLYTSRLITSEYGLVDLIQTYVTLLVPIVTLELEMSIFRYLIDSRDSEANTKKLMSNNFLILGISVSIFTVLYIIITSFVNVPLRWIILVDIIVCVLSGNFLQIARGFGRTLDYSISCILTGITTIVSNIILIVHFNMQANGMILSMALANFVCSLYLFLRLKMYRYFDIHLFDRKLIKEMNQYSIPLIPNGISWWIVNASDRSIITYTLGASFNGLYAVSNKFPNIISSLTGIFNLSWSESAALHINSPDRDEFFSGVINTVIKLFTSMGAGMLACMPFLFPLFVNEKYSEAYIYIPFLVLGTVFNVVICLYSQIYLAKKLSKEVAKTAVVGAVINVLINVLFIKKLGLYAAALSTTISYFVMMLYRYFDIKKYIDIKFEKGLLLKTILIYILVIFFYYQNNLILDIISLLIAVVYAFIINRKFLWESYKMIKEKFLFKNKKSKLDI